MLSDVEAAVNAWVHTPTVGAYWVREEMKRIKEKREEQRQKQQQQSVRK